MCEGDNKFIARTLSTTPLPLPLSLLSHNFKSCFQQRKDFGNKTQSKIFLNVCTLLLPLVDILLVVKFFETGSPLRVHYQAENEVVEPIHLLAFVLSKCKCIVAHVHFVMLIT